MLFRAGFPYKNRRIPARPMAGGRPLAEMKKHPQMPAYLIEIRDDAPSCHLSHAKVKKNAAKILRALGWKKAALSLWLVKDRQMAALNKRFLNHSGPTDIISFSQLEGKKLASAIQLQTSSIPLLGDLIISLDTTVRQAKEYGNDFFYELYFYLCHGVLHLMGYDDKTPRQAKQMERKQTAILKKIGIENVDRPRSIVRRKQKSY